MPVLLVTIIESYPKSEIQKYVKTLMLKLTQV